MATPQIDNAIKLMMATDWPSLYRINYTKYGWCIKAFTVCPGLSLRFPIEFVTGLTREVNPPNYDGAPNQDWINNVRPCLLRQGEQLMYDKFKEWVAKMLVGDEVTLEVLANAGNAEYEDPRNPIVMFVRECLTIRTLFSEEQMVRFLNEYWRQEAYNELGFELGTTLVELTELREDLGELLEELQAVHNDENGPVLWNEEDRQEDREHNGRMEERRAREEQERLENQQQ